MLKFQGSLDDLQNTVMRCAILGEWSYHKKNRFYRFRAATGAILNWWPSTGTINLQGHYAEQFETLFLEDALVAAAQSEPGLVGEEPVWEAVPGPTPSLNRARQVPSTAGSWVLSPRRAWVQKLSNSYPPLTRIEPGPEIRSVPHHSHKTGRADHAGRQRRDSRYLPLRINAGIVSDPRLSFQDSGFQPLACEPVTGDLGTKLGDQHLPSAGIGPTSLLENLTGPQQLCETV
jgi:hypothetical protein